MAKIGLIGFGKLGSYIFQGLESDESIDVNWVFDARKDVLHNLSDALKLDDFEDFQERNVDLVVEVANYEAVKNYAPLILQATNLMILSTTALANKDLESELTEMCISHNTRIYIPHAAMLGFDGIQDGKGGLDEITIRTVKPPSSLDFSYTDKWDMDDINDAPVTLYEGCTRELCSMFPRNVNSHASLAVAGLGFDKTQSILIADPQTAKVEHQITARWPGLVLEIKRSDEIERVTSNYTLVSLLNTIRRILGNERVLHIV